MVMFCRGKKQDRGEKNDITATKICKGETEGMRFRSVTRQRDCLSHSPTFQNLFACWKKNWDLLYLSRDRKGVKATHREWNFLVLRKRVLEQSDRLEARFGRSRGKGAYYTKRIHISSQPVLPGDGSIFCCFKKNMEGRI